jgi:hypothetical protein
VVWYLACWPLCLESVQPFSVETFPFIVHVFLHDYCNFHLLFIKKVYKWPLRITCVITKLMQCLSLVYGIITPLHVSGISTVHHQEAECIYVVTATCYTSKLTVGRPGWSGVQLHSTQANRGMV